MLTYAVVAYGDNKLVTAAPPIDPVDTVKFVHVMSWVIVDPDDTVKFPDDKVKKTDAFNPPVTTKPWHITGFYNNQSTTNISWITNN